MEKTDCRYYKKETIKSRASTGNIIGLTAAVKTSRCTHSMIGNQTGALHCEKCPYYEKNNKCQR